MGIATIPNVITDFFDIIGNTSRNSFSKVSLRIHIHNKNLAAKAACATWRLMNKAGDYMKSSSFVAKASGIKYTIAIRQ
jgi:hypothetical protein